MLERNLYVLWDKAQESIVGQPWLDNKDGAAARAFFEMCGNPQLIIGTHPADFELHCIAVVDLEEESCDDTDELLPRVVATGQLYLDMKESQNARTEQPPIRTS